MKNIDRIAEAYSGSFGNEMMNQSRERIHWICSQVRGDSVLDIGCSQGIVPIILAREGKNVQGIDICQESIDFAISSLENEDKSTKKHVEFSCIDFISFYEECNNKFDSVVISEVLEHLADPERFVIKAHRLLENNGRIVITVPFGINDYHDHKRTYYTAELYSMVSKYFRIEHVEFLDSYIGMVGIKTETAKEQALSEELIIRTERAFYAHERSILNKLEEVKSRLEDANTKYRQATENIANLKEEKKKDEAEKARIKTELAQMQTKLTQSQIQAQTELAQVQAQTQAEISQAQAEQTETLEKLKTATVELGQALSIIQRLDSQVAVLQAENSQYQWKLNRILNTWYGKFALRIYRLLRKIKRRIKR